MLRAFDSLARTLNLSETAECLGVTRQTVRRHLSDLESHRGGALFTLNKQSYALTDLDVAASRKLVERRTQQLQWLATS